MRKKYTFRDSNLDDQIHEIVESFNASKAPLPIYADNAAAIAGGLKVNDDYRTATGQRMVVF